MGLANAQTTHPSHLHRWSERSIAAYLEHKEAFRAPRATAAQEQGHDNSASYWNQFRPAFVCPWQDRIGRISEGGKWLCNWQALLSPPETWHQKDKAAATKTSETDPPCVIYSFGISKETSFEEALMARLHGRSNCHLWGFDPTVPGFPNSNIAGNPVFTKMGLNAKADAKQHSWPSKDLRSLMAERNHSHIDLLKIDIESSEWSLFDELCKGGPEAQPLPFDQLMIELHRVNAAHMHKLVKCLDAHGLYPFAREENLHGMACTDHPTNAGIHDVEMSFVRAPSRFTQAPLHGQPSSTLTTAAATAPASTSSLLSLSSLLPSMSSLSSPSSSTSTSDTLQPREGAKRWASVLQNEAILAREAFAKRGGMGNRGHPVGYGKGWEHMEAFRCSDCPYYLWDLFEPRAWCPDKQWVVADWTSSSSTSSSSQPSATTSARALCVPRFPSSSSSHRSGHRGNHAHHSSSHAHHGAGLLTGAASMEHVTDSGGAGGAVANWTCEVDVAGAEAAGFRSSGVSGKDFDPFASPQPAPPSLVASLAKSLGCANAQIKNGITSATATTMASASPGSGTGSSYRVLAANIDRASEWASATAAACRGDLDRYDQLMLDLTLVGKDILGAHASRRKKRDNTLVGDRTQQRRQLSLRSSSSGEAAISDFLPQAMPFLAPMQQKRKQQQQRKRKLSGLNEVSSTELSRNESTRRLGADADAASHDDGSATAKAWSRPAAASLSGLVYCLEDRGFRLAHREILFRDSPQAAPPVHAAALIFVRGS